MGWGVFSGVSKNLGFVYGERNVPYFRLSFVNLVRILREYFVFSGPFSGSKIGIFFYGNT
jgi:hypothetical protein